MNSIRVALAGKNALESVDPSHPQQDGSYPETDKFALYTDEDYVLIKEFSRGTGTVTAGNTAQITHNLGYVPAYLVYCQIGASEYEIAFSYNIYGDWKSYSDTSKLYIINSASAFSGYRYYIFYDQAV